MNLLHRLDVLLLVCTMALLNSLGRLEGKGPACRNLPLTRYQQKALQGCNFALISQSICICQFLPLSLDPFNNVQSARLTNCPIGTIEIVSLCLRNQTGLPSSFNIIHELSPFPANTY